MSQIKWTETGLQISGLFNLQGKMKVCAIGGVTNQGITVYQAYLLDETYAYIGEPANSVEEAKENAENWLNSQ